MYAVTSAPVARAAGDGSAGFIVEMSRTFFTASGEQVAASPTSSSSPTLFLVFFVPGAVMTPLTTAIIFFAAAGPTVRNATSPRTDPSTARPPPLASSYVGTQYQSIR